MLGAIQVQWMLRIWIRRIYRARSCQTPIGRRERITQILLPRWPRWKRLSNRPSQGRWLPLRTCPKRRTPLFQENRVATAAAQTPEMATTTAATMAAITATAAEATATTAKETAAATRVMNDDAGGVR